MKTDLANNIYKALYLRHAGPTTTVGLSMRIRKGHADLNELMRLAEKGKCTLTYLVSGGEYEYRGEMPTHTCIEASVRHCGRDWNDTMRELGITPAYAKRTIQNGTVKVLTLIRLAKLLKIPLEQLLSDGECEKLPPQVRIENTPSPRVINRDLYRMGWME